MSKPIYTLLYCAVDFSEVTFGHPDQSCHVNMLGSWDFTKSKCEDAKLIWLISQKNQLIQRFREYKHYFNI